MRRIFQDITLDNHLTGEQRLRFAPTYIVYPMRLAVLSRLPVSSRPERARTPASHGSAGSSH